jgi:hypothetical protein
MATPQFFHAHETARADEVNGLPLASFVQRAVGFSIDFALVALFRKPIEFAWEHLISHGWERHTLIDFHHLRSLIVLVIYFVLALYFGKGQTVGKRIVGTRVLSLEHERLSLWHAVERVLGYGASMLEGGFGFVQFFINRNRQCVHDRIAETIVVDVRKTAVRSPALQPLPLAEDTV